MNEVSVGQEYYDKRIRDNGHSPRVVAVTRILDFGYVEIKNNYTGRKVQIKSARLLNKSRFELVASPAPIQEHEAVAA